MQANDNVGDINKMFRSERFERKVFEDIFFGLKTPKQSKKLPQGKVYKS